MPVSSLESDISPARCLYRGTVSDQVVNYKNAYGVKKDVDAETINMFPYECKMYLLQLVK